MVAELLFRVISSTSGEFGASFMLSVSTVRTSLVTNSLVCNLNVLINYNYDIHL